MTPRLAARDIVVVRRGRRVLDGAAIEIERGSLATIEGASGSGKSTFLRVVALLIEPDSGRVERDGVDALAGPPESYRQKVAYVAQAPVMFDGTVLENLAAGPGFAGRSVGEASAVALIERVGLDPEVLTRPAGELSGGEQLRVALARSLANDPDVLLLDEPTSALDPASAATVVALVRALVAGGIAALVVTHSGEIAEALGGQRYRAQGGKIEPIGRGD